MRLIKIEPYANGAHANQASSGTVNVPDGWAVIPDGMELPDTYPFVELTVSKGVVVHMEPGNIVAPEEAPAEESGDLAARVEALEAAVAKGLAMFEEETANG